MKTRLILSAAVLALAACGSPDKSGGNGSAAATGGGGSASGISLQPGEWEMKTEVVNVDVEGLPAGIAEGMKAQAGGTSRSCMTPEEAKGPKGDMFAGGKANCKSEGFSWAGGRIKGKTTCTGQGGAGKTVMEMDGRYSPQSIDMTMKSETDLGVGGKAMKMEMRVSGRRVGECSDSTKKG
ncbi:MAG: hypothetical protein QOG72_2214 [Sphingomonadales bacterium]|jgi:hypothetical protein|nr:hypothetical protein [Sphingomonadales bacterium]